MSQVYWVLDKMHREVQKHLDKKTHIKIKRNKKILWKSVYKLNDEEKQKVQKLIQIDSRLIEAYEMKNTMDKWYTKSDKNTVTDGFNACIRALGNSSLEPFHRVKNTFKRWKSKVLHSFMYPFNNGYIEGVINTIKVLKKNFYGIKDFDRLENKTLRNKRLRK